MLDRTDLVIAVSGIIAGVVNTVAGGGSLLTVPALMLAGLPVEVANATNRLCVLSQSATGVLAFRRAGRFSAAGAWLLLVPSGLGAVVGTLSAAVLPRAILKPTLLGAMIVLAIVMAVVPSALKTGEGERALTLRERPLGAVALFFTGVYGGFVQAGVGFLLLGALTGILRYDLARSNALKLWCTLAFGAISVLIFGAVGQVMWHPALILAIATAVGSELGVRVAVKLSSETARRVVLGAVVVLLAVVLVRGK